MNKMTLADYAEIHGQAKAASDFGVIQCAISKASKAARNEVIAIVTQQLDRARGQSGRITNFVTNRAGR